MLDYTTFIEELSSLFTKYNDSLCLEFFKELDAICSIRGYSYHRNHKFYSEEKFIEASKYEVIAFFDPEDPDTIMPCQFIEEF